MSIIIQKNTLCANKVGVIYFCQNCVNVLPENVHFLFLFFLGGGRLPPHCPPARAPMGVERKY